MIKALLLDLDGTLIDSELIPRLAWIDAARHFGFEAEEAFLNQLTGMTKKTAQELVKKVIPKDVDMDEFQAYRHQYMNDYMKENGIKAKRGARELLLKAKAENVECIVVTSSYAANVRMKLEMAGLADLIDKIICGDEVENGKPAPDIYLLALERYHLNKEECIVLEDSKNGLLSAENAGIRAILIPDLVAPDDEMKKSCELQLVDLMEVAEYIFKD